MLYRIVRPLLFALDPETAHGLSLKSLDVLARLGAASLAASRAPSVPVRVMGLDFPNPVGLAAGLGNERRRTQGAGAPPVCLLPKPAGAPPAPPRECRAPPL